MADITKQLAETLGRYVLQDEELGHVDNSLYHTARANLAAYDAQEEENSRMSARLAYATTIPSAFVTTWYDQSGFAVHATQTTAAAPAEPSDAAVQELGRLLAREQGVYLSKETMRKYLKAALAAAPAKPTQAQHYSTTDGRRCDNCGGALSKHENGGRDCPAPAPHPDTKDAERYRWLRDPKRIPKNGNDTDGYGDGHILVCDHSGEDVLWLSQLDRAIDAAIMASKGGAAHE